jgi:hypothetical protein
MDPVELLVRGVTGLLVTVILVVAARVRFRSEESESAPTDIGLD